MEIVKKQLYLNPYVSKHFSLIPYIVKDAERQTSPTMGYTYIEPDTFSENGNYGCYPYDVDIERCDVFRTHSDEEINPSSLKPYFTSKKVSFKELSDKFALLKKIVCNAKYYETVYKNKKVTWVERKLTFAEKLDKNVYDTFPTIDDWTYMTCGIHSDNSYIENGGKEMLLFLFKAMGMFVVSPLYITEENGVPEVMYYTGIKSYLNRMDKVKNSDICCVKNEYEYLGGDVFYGYLMSKLGEIDKEINYWFYSLYRDENSIPEPVIHMSLGLNEECYNIGNYMAIPNTTGETKMSVQEDFKVRAVRNESPLKTLRRTKITRYDVYVGGDTWETVEFPMILDEINVNENNEAEGYELTQPYIVGYPKNTTQVNGTEIYYGDMIYQMDFLKEYEYNQSYITDSCTFDMDGNIVSGTSYANAEDFLTRQDKAEYLPEYTGKVTGSTDEEYDVWDDSEKAKEEGLNEFSHKYNCRETKLYGKDKNGNTIQTGYTLTYSANLYDFEKTIGYVHIYYVIGGQLELKDGEWGYVDKTTNSNSEINVRDFLKNTNVFNGGIDDYMFIKDKLDDLNTTPNKYETDKIYYKGELNEYNTEKYPENGTGEIWLYKINFRHDIKRGSEIESFYIGDYIITYSNGTSYHFNIQKIKDRNFTGVRYYEKKRWTLEDFDGKGIIKMLFEDNEHFYGSSLAVNILDKDSKLKNGDTIVKNLDNVELVEYINMDEIIEGYFITNDSVSNTISSNLLLMNDYEFGKIEMIVENTEDVLIDRGFVSTFELHYKLSEINTMEDMENYGNNFFGL